MRFALLTVGVLAAGLLLAGFSESVFRTDGIKITRDLRYGDRDDAREEGEKYKSYMSGRQSDGHIMHSHRSGQYYDLLHRDGPIPADAPVYVHLHGGAWCQPYDKDGEGLNFIGRLVNCGFVVVNMDYQLQNDVTDGTRELWRRSHASFDDMLRDIDALVTHLKTVRLPALGIKTEKIAIGGGSAGAHLSALYAYDETNPDWLGLGLKHELKIGFVMDFVGPTDLASEDFYDPLVNHSFPIGAMFNEWSTDRLLILLGWLTNADLKGMIAKGKIEDARSVLAKYSPLRMITEKSCPTILEYSRLWPGATTDGCVPVSTYDDHIAALEKANVPYEAHMSWFSIHGNPRSGVLSSLVSKCEDYAEKYLKK